MRSRSRRRRCKVASARPNRRASRRHECGRVHACPSPLETHAAEARARARVSFGNVRAAERGCASSVARGWRRVAAVGGAAQIALFGVSAVRVGSRPPQAAELVKLNGIINEGDAELQRQRKEYDNVVNERNILGTQVRGCAALPAERVLCVANLERAEDAWMDGWMGGWVGGMGGWDGMDG